MKKRGISPLVATVILISIVIIIALLLWFWYNQFIEEQREKSQTHLAQECVQNTEIKIRESSCSEDSGEYTISVDVGNVGRSKVTNLLFNVISGGSSTTTEVGKVLESGTSSDISIRIQSSDLDGEDPNEVKVIPVVSKGTVKKYCEDQAEYTSINC
jgi:flagellin-like protein